MFGLGPLEITLIVLILLVLFGAKRIPLVIGAIGQGIRQFKSNVSSDELPAGDAKAEVRDRQAERDERGPAPRD